ncbi:MAG: hypothetical protein KBG16_05405 [Methanospirillum sp.]|nr:hypothetical protein [Methanospirillum sp.]
MCFITVNEQDCPRREGAMPSDIPVHICSSSITAGRPIKSSSDRPSRSSAALFADLIIFPLSTPNTGSEKRRRTQERGVLRLE